MIKKLFSRTHLVFLLLLTICVITCDATADTVQYTYDDAGRLTKADYGDKSISYKYDNAGNLLEKKISDSTAAANPVPDVKANGSDGPVTIGTSDTLSITVSLSAGDNAGVNCDWWLAESTSSGWNYYSLSTSWTSAGSSYTGLSPTYQGALFDLGTYSVSNTSGLSAGTHTFYFAIDTNMNGSLDMGSIYYDSVQVNVTP